MGRLCSHTAISVRHRLPARAGRLFALMIVPVLLLRMGLPLLPDLIRLCGLGLAAWHECARMDNPEMSNGIPTNSVDAEFDRVIRL
jgi:hypothetical protein